MNRTTPLNETAGQPYPLLRRFVVIAGPVFVLFLIGLGVSSVVAVRGTVADIYLRIAEQRAAGIATDLRANQPEAWTRLIAGTDLAPGDYDGLAKVFAAEAVEFHLDRLKVYNAAALTLFSALPAEVGTFETGDALRAVLGTGRPGLAQTTDPDGDVYYELYVPLHDGDRLVAVFELYEPISYLDSLLLSSAGPAAIVPIGLLSLLVVVLYRLARRAQHDIDWRTLRIAELTKRVEGLVSRRAVQAMHGADASGHPDPHLVECTLFFSDVRGFTAFSEGSPPGEVIAALNRIIAVQAEVLESNGADVDKFIGDAVFARFEGPERAAAAVRASLEIQRQLRERPQPLTIGIGIASGSVVAGVIGAADRYDYTVLGDAVNVASRLCSAARAGETVVDQATADAAAVTGGTREAIAVKGRAATVNVVRLAGAGAA